MIHSDRGVQFTSWAFSRNVRDAALASAVRLHDLRHTAATLWLASGQSIYFVQQQLGHKDIQTTIDLYGHPDQAAHRAAADKAAAWCGGKGLRRGLGYRCWYHDGPSRPAHPATTPRRRALPTRRLRRDRPARDRVAPSGGARAVLAVDLAQRDLMERLVVVDFMPEIARELEEPRPGQSIVLVYYNDGEEHASLVVCPAGDLAEKLRKRRSIRGVAHRADPSRELRVLDRRPSSGDPLHHFDRLALGMETFLLLGGMHDYSFAENDAPRADNHGPGTQCGSVAPPGAHA